MTKKVGGEKVTLSISDYFKIGGMFATIFILLVSVKADIAKDNERINQLEMQNIIQKNYNNDQIMLNKCIQNAFAIEFGKNLYYYNDQFVYRSGNKTQ